MNLKKHTYWIKGIAFALVLALGCPALPMKAAETTALDVKNEGGSEDLTQGTTVMDIDESEEGTEQEFESSDSTEITDDSQDVPEESMDNTFAETQEEVGEGAVSEDEDIEQRMNYVYVESSYLETPGTQRVVVSWGDGSEDIEDMSMDVQSADGTQETWAVARAVDNLYLFEKEYSNDEQRGTYEALGITVKTTAGEKYFTMEEMGTEVLFGVNEEYAGSEELKLIAGEGIEEAGGVSVATINEDGTLEAEDSIAEALAQAGAEVQAQTPQMKNRSVATVDNTRAGNIVVALDPGHDASSIGASANGLHEEVLTLKIANYCKEELEQYSGVTVIMTRTTAACPYGISGSGCIKYRVRDAVAQGAKIFVSFHLNAANGAAHGAEVIVPNSSWRPDISASGSALGNAIFDELAALGLAKRSVYSKNTSINERYPDGSLADYFAVNRYSKIYGIPGIIVEHAFIDNSSDANNFLSSEAGLKKLGVADATGIAKYLGLSKKGAKIDVPEGTYVLQSALNNNKVLNISGASEDNFAKVTISQNKDISSQRFEVISTGDGYYNIVSENSGKALEVAGGTGTAGELILQNSLNINADAQKWYFTDAGNGYCYLNSALGTCADVHSAGTADGTTVWTYTFNGSDAQKWMLAESEYRPIEDGTYTFVTAVDETKAMEVTNGAFDNFTNVQLNEKSNTSSQKFEVSYVGDGYYQILAEHSGKSLDILNGSRANGGNLQQYAWNNSSAQLWKFLEADDGTYYIRSMKGTNITLESSSAAKESNIYMWEKTGKASQKWRLEKSEIKPIEDGEYVIVSQSAQYQAITEKNSNIQLETYNNSENQKFKVEYVGNGYYKIILRSTGKSLDVTNASASSGANLGTSEWNKTSAQLWKFIETGDGSYYIKSKLGTALDLVSGGVASGTNIQMYAMNGTAAQKWVLDKDKVNLSEQPIKDGTYTIKNATGTNQVLDVTSASESNYANVQTYLKNDTSAQHFEISYVGNGYYKIIAEHSGKSLDVFSGLKSAGANIQQYEWNNSEAQLWKFIKKEDNQYYIQSKLGTVIEVNGSAAASGRNVQTGNMGTKNTQAWMLEEVSLENVSDGLYSICIAADNTKVLDVMNGSTQNGANIQLYQYNMSEAQKFNISYVDKGYYKIQNKKSGKVLEVDPKNGNVKQNEWNNTEVQLWKFVKNSDGIYYIKTKTGTTLDVYCGILSSGSNVQTYTVNGSAAQKWMLKEEKDYKVVDVKEGIYVIRTALNNGRVLDVFSGLKTDGANVQIYADNQTAAQRFKVSKVGDGYYKIISELSGKALDIAGASIAAGANVWQYSWNGSDAQLWRFLDAGDGKYYIQSKLGTVLDVWCGGTALGTNVDAYTLNETLAQKWILDNSNLGLYRIMGITETNVDQMAAFFKARATVPYPYEGTDAPTIEEFCRMYIEECAAEGVKAEVAFCQAMLETGFLKFRGDVQWDQYNFAGLGATGGGVPGDRFPDIRTGIRAQVQHLKAYASTAPLVNPSVDKRFSYVSRGCAEYVEWLGIQENPYGKGWAAGKNYGYNIVNLYILPLKAF